MSEPVRRKLTSIFCADVAGYSRLMDSDEADTLARLKQYRHAMAGLIERHHGRVVNTWGDAVIAEFASPVEAVRAAVEVQHELAARNNGLADDRRMVFRIGINLGDVMLDGDDLYGEGVNVAARLQALAQPGGVTISGTVYELVHRKFDIGFEFSGEQQVKNIAEPVPSYRLLLNGKATAAVHSHPAPPPRQTSGGGLPGRLAETIRGLPHKAKFALSMIGFFFLINLFSGLGSLWFQWPSLPFLLILLWSLLGSDGRHRRDRRRRHDPSG